MYYMVVYVCGCVLVRLYVYVFVYMYLQLCMYTGVDTRLAACRYIRPYLQRCTCMREFVGSVCTRGCQDEAEDSLENLRRQEEELDASIQLLNQDISAAENQVRRLGVCVLPSSRRWREITRVKTSSSSFLSSFFLAEDRLFFFPAFTHTAEESRRKESPFVCVDCEGERSFLLSLPLISSLAGRRGRRQPSCRKRCW